ncbi:MAG TPA: sugar ABC transporter substrate-binding protein [Chloroflexota bacterium]|jgi:ribose transport system substrate-binding protein
MIIKESIGPRTRMVGAAFILCSLLAAGNGGTTMAATRQLGAPAAKTLNFLWVQPLRNHPVHRLMQAGFLNECKKLGVQCDIVGNPSATIYDVPASVALASAALASKHYSCVAVYDPVPSINPFIAKLGKAGYPVATWHVMPKQGSVPGLDAATAENIAQVGDAAAMAMGKKMGGKGTIAVTQGSYNATEDPMAAAFRATIAAHFPKIKVLPSQLENFEPSAAVAKAVSILQGNPAVTGAFSTTGNGPQTWAGAERESGRSLVIIGMDYIRQNLDLVKSGKVFAVAAQPLYPEGAKAADLCNGLATGKKVPYYNPLAAKIVTKADLAPYYGYLKQAGE